MSIEKIVKRSNRKVLKSRKIRIASTMLPASEQNALLALCRECRTTMAVVVRSFIRAGLKKYKGSSPTMLFEMVKRGGK